MVNQEKMWHGSKQLLLRIVSVLQMRFPNIVVVLHNLLLIYSVHLVTSNIPIKLEKYILKYILNDF